MAVLDDMNSNLFLEFGDESGDNSDSEFLEPVLHVELEHGIGGDARILEQFAQHGKLLPIALRIRAVVIDSSEQVIAVLEEERVELFPLLDDEVVGTFSSEDVLTRIDHPVLHGKDLPDVVNDDVLAAGTVVEVVEKLLVAVQYGELAELEADTLGDGDATELGRIKDHVELLLDLAGADGEDVGLGDV